AWSEGAHPSLAPYTPPEIVDADLAPLALELASWGVREAAALRWLDAPPAAQLASARQLLERLGALDDGGRITAHGREMARLGAHPRLAHMLLRARSLGQLPLAAQLAALLTERDLLRGIAAASDADIRTRLEILRAEEGAPVTDRPALERARRAARDLERQAGGQSAGGRDQGTVGPLLAFAYPDRIGRARAGGDGRFALANGRGAAFGSPQALARRELGVEALPWDREARDLQARIEFVRAAAGVAETGEGAWPAASDAALADTLESWLAPWLQGITRREHLARVPLAAALRARLSFEQRRALEEWAPSELSMPSGSRARVDYHDAGAPAVSVRLQEVFGLAQTPPLGRGRVPVTFRLLSPAGRPVQVTRDLASFWRGAYAEVRKVLRGRYPKH